MKPSDFLTFPYGSVFQKSECETVALNAMVILSRTGDKFKKLSAKKYEEERRKDGNFSSLELKYLSDVSPYLKSATTAILFSKAWSKPKQK